MSSNHILLSYSNFSKFNIDPASVGRNFVDHSTSHFIEILVDKVKTLNTMKHVLISVFY